MLRFGFVTCVQLGLTCMETIYQCGGKLEFAGTLHDDQARAKSGRVYLDEFCNHRGIPLHKFRNINDPDAVEKIRAAALDWLFVIGWSQIARGPVLEATRLGALGMHPTLLPTGRGRAAIPWAILLGLAETGVTLFKLDTGVDTGPIVAQTRVPISSDESATTLYQKVDQAHRALITVHWEKLAAGRLTPIAQNDDVATEWPGRTPEQGRLDPMMTFAEAEGLVRAVTHPYPGAFIDLEGRRLRIWRAGPVVGALHRETTEPDFPVIRFCDGGLEVLDGQWETPPAV